ncbi:hypothetical protein [Streptomyces sp. NPDC050560]|uniref:hypothetical protein n=1 Tax=Streptomyces sp. NPDC050560 TaxID=3365630 RepID=UPI0037B14F1C
MNGDEQDTRASGSVAHAYRNALFWRWAPAMPKGIPAAFVTLLYALASAADPAGRVRFRDGSVIRIKDIAAACKADEKDVRRYLTAAVAAGVVAVEGEQRRGRPTLYVLMLTPSPDWGAAVDAITNSKRKRPERTPPPWRQAAPGADQKNGGRSPELPEDKNGGPPPELSDLDHEKERGTAPRTSSGDRPPFGSGDRPPNNPGRPMSLPHEVAEVEPQPPVDVAPAPTELPENHEPRTADVARCAVCHERMIPRPGRDRHTHCITAGGAT